MPPTAMRQPHMRACFPCPEAAYLGWESLRSSSAKLSCTRDFGLKLFRSELDGAL